MEPTEIRQAVGFIALLILMLAHIPIGLYLGGRGPAMTELRRRQAKKGD